MIRANKIKTTKGETGSSDEGDHTPMGIKVPEKEIITYKMKEDLLQAKYTGRRE